MNKRQYKKHLAKRKHENDETGLRLIHTLHKLTPENYFIAMCAMADLLDNTISVTFDMDEYTEKKLAVYNSEQQQEAINELNSRLGFIAVEEESAKE